MIDLPGYAIGLAFAPLLNYCCALVALAFAPLLDYWLRAVALAFAPLLNYWLRAVALAFAPLITDVGEARGRANGILAGRSWLPIFPEPSPVEHREIPLHRF